MAKLLEIDEKELLTIWLADKVLDTVDGEDEVKHGAVIYSLPKRSVLILHQDAYVSLSVVYSMILLSIFYLVC